MRFGANSRVVRLRKLLSVFLNILLFFKSGSVHMEKKSIEVEKLYC